MYLYIEDLKNNYMEKYKVKVITLLRRQDRRDKLEKQQFFKNINFEYVVGINGQEYELTDFDKEFIKGNDYEKYNIHIPSLVAANYTHLNLLEECASQDLPYFIFEDDTEQLQDFPLELVERIANRKNIDYYWLVADQPTILAYVIWPKGAEKIIEHVTNTAKLSRGLDWQIFEMKKNILLRGDQVKSSYFTQVPGKDSDITNLENYEK